MKKLLFAFPVVALLAAGCNSAPQASNQTPVVQHTNPTSTPTPTPSPTTENSSNTKTYINNYGYQFTYSTDYNLDITNTVTVGLRNKSDNTTDAYGNKTPTDIRIEYFNDLTKLPYYQNHPNSIKNVNDYLAQSGTDKTISNVTSYVNKNGVLVLSFSDDGLKVVYTELIPHNGHYYQISFFKRETGDQLNSDEKQVQQTFDFTK